MFYIFFYFLFTSNTPFLSLEEGLEKVRKADTLFELKMNLDYYGREIERIKRENKIDEAEKLRLNLEYDFNKALIKKYNWVLKIIEEDPFFVSFKDGLGEYKIFLEEINLKIVEKENLENFNREILEKLGKIYRTFKDPCPEYFQMAETTKDLKTRVENYCKISKNPCLFSSEIKENVNTKMEEIKVSLISAIRKREIEKIENLYGIILKCFEKEESFREEIVRLEGELLREMDLNLEKKECQKAEKNLKILKILKGEISLERYSSICKKEDNCKNREEKKEDFEKREEKKEIRVENFEREFPYIILDIWQSAWEDFSDLVSLINYIKKNKISEINLNIGMEITKEKETEKRFKNKLKEILPELYNSGIKKVNLLYAELNYPIEGYARFLSENAEIGIKKIVDDSEFTDRNFQQYLNNYNSTKKHGINYSTFVTLEREGNSGVSDRTRFELIEKADEVILMSYFTCNLEEQKRWLEPYFEYSDKIGKRNNLRVAILFGSKSVGREVSCEKLEKEKLKEFIFGLHNWALNFSSYSGIVFETNKKLPPDIY